ncbi:MAG: insulinase family protein [Oscillospiraceae bacterium]|jgi:predicted Zn-dependent peptidase|nr:insulinase family protein [Oscillospiraceae bacterium]
MSRENIIKTVEDSPVGEKYMILNHKSGLTVFLCPMKKYSAMYAQFTARYGSLDTAFRTDAQKDFTRVPAGIAHFLEHKMFEDEEGDAFMKFAQTGANANAYTSSDRTSYELSCTSGMMENLEILLSMLTKPYFTEESIRKEREIITQEINMYRDSPYWNVYFNLLRSLYHRHPITVDIAGTAESIAKIDRTLLLFCHGVFYNLHNMALSVSGNFEADEVIELCDRILESSPEIKIDREFADEPPEVRRSFFSKRLPVATPIFEIGFKNSPLPKQELLRKSIAADIALEALCGETSALYSRLYNAGLITDSFDSELACEKDLFAIIFSGESNKPQAVLDELLKEIEEFRQNGVNEEDFRRVKKYLYGKFAMGYSDVESIANALTNAFIEERTPFEGIRILPEISIKEVNDAIREYFDFGRLALSVVEPVN